MKVGATEDGIDAADTVRLVDLGRARLAVVADVLTKSAALGHQETTLGAPLDEIEPVVTDLAHHGRLSILSRRLLRSIGKALAARNRAPARVQVDDKPDVLWDHPGLERLHARLVDHRDLVPRAARLERKPTRIGETVQTLLSLVQTRRSFGLEIAVAAFITIEVVTTIWEAFVK
jgi:uncharacterized Rmd1/YagE family protein